MVIGYSSFANVFRFKAQIKELCPGSLVVIDHHTINEKKSDLEDSFVL